MLLNNQWITEEIKEEIKKKKKLETKWKHNDPKPMKCSKSSSKDKVHSKPVLTQKTNKKINHKHTMETYI